MAAFSPQNTVSVPQEKPVDLKQSLFHYLIHPWYFYLIGLCLFTGGAWLYLRYATKQYQAKCTLLVKTPDSGTDGMQESFLLEEMGGISSLKNIENEIQVLKSRALMTEVVNKLDLNVKYESKGYIRIGEIYKHSPILVDSFKLNQGIRNLKLEVKPLADNQLEVLQNGAVLGNTGYDSIFNCKSGSFRFHRNFPVKLTDEPVVITFLHPEDVIRYYAGLISARRVGEYSTVLEISLRDPVAEKAADILNTLISVYNNLAIREKNKKWQNTYDFINDRLKYLTAELSDAENNVEQFKTRNTLPTGIENDVSAVTEEFRLNDQNISKIDLQLNLLSQLERVLARQQDSSSLLPINFAFENADLNTQVVEYNNLLQEQKHLLESVSPQHNLARAGEARIKALQKVMQSTLAGARENLSYNRKSLEDKNASIQSRIKSLPGIERELIDITRQKNIKENLYIYLLQKREEAALSMAISLADAKVIDTAESPIIPVSPQPILIYALAILLGLGFPLAWVILRDLLNDDIQTPEDIKQLTDAPQLGSIALSKTGEQVVVSRESRTAVAEMFRLLRTNLQFLHTSPLPHAFMVTSSASGEGKSFVTLNLGLTFALSGKKTCLVALDLRKPKLGQYLGAEGAAPGITHLLIGQATAEQLIRPSGLHPDLFWVANGPIPPNPSELIQQPVMDEFFAFLRSRFDYILIDTPPVGLVSDALLLSKHTDGAIFILRQGITKKAAGAFLDELRRQDKLVNVGIVLNGVNMRRKQGYGYGYGYGYYDDDFPENGKKTEARKRTRK